MDITFLLSSLLFMNFGQQSFVDYANSNCHAMNTGSMIGRCNRVFNHAAITDEDVADIKNYFKDIHFTWAIDKADTKSTNFLLRHGLHYKAHAPIMMLELDRVKDRAINPLLTMKEVNDEHDFNAWIDITGTNYNYDKKELARAIRFLKQRAGDYLTLYLGYYDGKPAASCMIAYHDNNLVSMHLIGTLLEMRSNGLGMLMLQEPLAIAYKKGYAQAVLIPSTMGLPLALKLGFKEYYTYEIYGNY